MDSVKGPSSQSTTSLFHRPISRDLQSHRTCFCYDRLYVGLMCPFHLDALYISLCDNPLLNWSAIFFRRIDIIQHYHSHDNIVQDFWWPLLFSAARARPPKIALFSAATDTTAENKALFSVAEPWPPKIVFFKQHPDFFFFLFSSKTLYLSAPSPHPPPRRAIASSPPGPAAWPAPTSRAPPPSRRHRAASPPPLLPPQG
jgi:hypothetical protein